MMLSFKYTIPSVFSSLHQYGNSSCSFIGSNWSWKTSLSALSSQSAFYDEKSDTVYLFGGRLEFIPEIISNYDIYAFSVSNKTITEGGEIPTNVGKFTTTHVIPSSKSDTSHLLVLFFPTLLRSIHCRLFIQRNWRHFYWSYKNIGFSWDSRTFKRSEWDHLRFRRANIKQ